MKVQNSKPISAFGGINFVLKYIEDHQINDVIERNLPELRNQSTYSWTDIFNSLLSIYLCGGDCMEDLQTHLKSHFQNNPFVKIPSPDTVLRRLAGLSEENKTCRTKRGSADHHYNTNVKLEQLNIALLKKLGSFDADQLFCLKAAGGYRFRHRDDSQTR